MVQRKTKPATFKHGGIEYTLHLGTAAFIQLEKSLGVSIEKMGETLKSPNMATIRDLFAAALITHHPQARDNPLTDRLAGTIFGMGPKGPGFTWEAQQDLADELLDAVGMAKAAELIAAAVETSPHMQGEPEAAAA